MKEIFVDIQRCTACKACEIACAVEHSASKELFGAIAERPVPQKRVHIMPAEAYAYPVRCMHCGDAPCIAACPNGAMGRNPDSGAVVVNESRCLGCLMCAMVCPFGAISAHSAKKVAVKCDRCSERQALGEQPACVDACPTHALLFVDGEDLMKKTRLDAATRMAQATAGAAEEKPGSSPMDTLRSLGGR